MTKRKRKRKKRGPYNRVFCKPIVDLGNLKTTSKEGYKKYMREYMRKWRKLKK